VICNASAQSLLVDQFGLVYEPLDFYVPVMRGVTSSMDANRNVASTLPLHSAVACSSSVSRRPEPDFNPDHLMPCIQEANLKCVARFPHFIFVTISTGTGAGCPASQPATTQTTSSSYVARFPRCIFVAFSSFAAFCNILFPHCIFVTF
jgi:hypothetical protein